MSLARGPFSLALSQPLSDNRVSHDWRRESKCGGEKLEVAADSPAWTSAHCARGWSAAKAKLSPIFMHSVMAFFAGASNLNYYCCATPKRINQNNINRGIVYRDAFADSLIRPGSYDQVGLLWGFIIIYLSSFCSATPELKM